MLLPTRPIFAQWHSTVPTPVQYVVLGVEVLPALAIISSLYTRLDFLWLALIIPLKIVYGSQIRTTRLITSAKVPQTIESTF